MRKLFSRCSVLIMVSVLLSVLLVNSATAQDSASITRDPQSLAQRYLGFKGDAPVPPLTPAYKVGDKAQFWVGKVGSVTPARVTATLAASAPNAYIWVEDGVAATGNLMQTVLQISQFVTVFRVHDNYRKAVNSPDFGAISDSTDLLPIPDVDNDPHLYVLYTTQLSQDRDAVLNPNDSLNVAYAPYSNQHEMLYVNTTPYPGTRLDDAIYSSMLVRAIYRWIIQSNVPDQAVWLTEMLNWSIFLTIEQQKVDSNDLSAYLQAPDTPLLQAPSATTLSPALGGQQLFLNYILQRYGSDPLVDLFLQPGSGISPLDAVLKKRNIIDPVTGAPVTGRDAFADFVMTNGLDLAFGDGRYVENVIQLPSGQVAATTLLNPKAALSGLSVNQFGAQYYGYTNAGTTATTVSVGFKGNPTSARLSMPADRDPANPFYWSGLGDNRDTTLTRSVDLTSASKATLTFDAWYSLSPDWDYGYVSVSSDDGATWKPLRASTSSGTSPNGVAYGDGFTGVSNPAKPHPFPSIGIVIEGDGVTINDLVPNGAAAKAGLQKGDVIIGYDNKEWTGAPNVIALLANYAPGDTLHLYVQHGTQRSDVPVVLGANPTRVVQPPPLWLSQSVDLTPYAGKKIELRFEAVSLPGHEDQGFAVDNLAIPEIQWADDASGDFAASGWSANGWQQVDNQVAQNWVVQAATSGTQTTYPRVQTLISSNPTDRADVASTGEWRFSLAPNESIILAVSGVNDDTTERANFSLGFKN